MSESKKRPENLKTINVRMDPEEWNRFRAVTQIKNIGPGELVTNFIREWMEEPGQKVILQSLAKTS